MIDLMHARVVEHLQHLRLRHIAERLDAVLSEAARKQPTYLDFLDGLLRDEMDSKQRKRIAMGVQIAHVPAVKTLDDFDFAFQPSLDQRLVQELATSRFVATGENVILFAPPGVGKTHLAIALGRAAVEHGHSVLFITAAALLGALARAESDGQLNDKLAFFAKPKLLVIDELGYLPLEQRGAHLSQLVARRHERSSTFVTTKPTRHPMGDPRPSQTEGVAVVATSRERCGPAGRAWLRSSERQVVAGAGRWSSARVAAR